jgi:hypothetical protein
LWKREENAGFGKRDDAEACGAVDLLLVALAPMTASRSLFFLNLGKSRDPLPLFFPCGIRGTVMHGLVHQHDISDIV